MELKKLTEVCSPKQWKTISQTEMLPEGYPVYGANGIIGYYNEYNHENPTVLITCRGATCGTLNISKPFSYVNGNAMALDNVIEDVDEKYLYYYLQSRGLKDIISGSAQPQITIQNLTKVIVSYPSIEQQKRIVSMLDKADEIRAKKKLANDKLDEFLKSTFISMFGDPVKNEKKWLKSCLGDVCDLITDGTHKTPQYKNSGIKFISAKNVKNAHIDLSDTKFISEEEHLALTSRCKPEFEDIVLTKSGSIGSSAIIDFVEPVSLFESLALIKYCRNKLNCRYLNNLLNGESIKNTYINNIKGISIKHLHLNEIKKISIIMPPIEQQNKFAKIVEHVEAQKQKNELVIEQMNNLFNSLSQRAFKGSANF